MRIKNHLSKMKKKRQPIGSDNVVEISVPDSWESLTGKQFRRVVACLTSGRSLTSLKMDLFFDFAGMKPLHREGDCFRCKLKGYKGSFLCSPEEIAMAIRALDWVEQQPATPIRPEKLRQCRALDPFLRGESFETFLTCESYFQGYVSTSDENLLDELAAILYPGLKPGKVRPFDRYFCFLWFSGFKSWLMQKYPDFFIPMGAGDSDFGDNEPPDMAKVIAVQVRALTKGDVTKNRQVLESEVHDALAELDALAAEYRKLKASEKKCSTL